MLIVSKPWPPPETSAPEVAPRFYAARVKVRRASRHIAELEAEISKFSGSDAVTLEVYFTEGEAKPEAAFRLVVPPLPETVIASFGDAVHNLRSALDLMASELARNAKQSDQGVYFPFSDQPEGLDIQIKAKKFSRAGEKAVALLKSLKPYKGGNVALRELHDLDVRDKHKTVLFAAFVSDGILFRVRDEENRPIFHLMPEGPSPSIKLLFQENSVFSGKEIIPTLRGLVKLVDGVIDAFANIPVADGAETTLLQSAPIVQRFNWG